MDNESKAIEVSKASEVATHYEGKRLNEMYKLATEFTKANCFGGDVQNPQQALVKMQAGYEMGMPPVEAMNSLYIVKGKITIWGSAMAKRLRLHGWEITYDDKEDQCTVTIEKSGQKPKSYCATATELRKLNSKAFQFAPKEKLRWHALSRLIRFEVPEVLDAGVGYLKEEAEDMPGVEVIDAAPVLEQAETHDINGMIANIEELKTAEELMTLAERYGKLSLDKEEAKMIALAIKDKAMSFKPESAKGDNSGKEAKAEVAEKKPEQATIEDNPKADESKRADGPADKKTGEIKEQKPVPKA